MKLPTISLKRTLEVTMNDASKRLMELDGLDKKALKKSTKNGFKQVRVVKNSHTFFMPTR